MLLHERRNETSDAARQGPPPVGSANVDQLRQAGESHLQAAEEAIDRVLAGDSLAFLRSTQQDGGQ